VLDLVKAGIANVTAFSLGCGFPVTSSIPHLILNAFNNVLAVSLATDYTFPQAQKIKEILADPSKFLAAAATSAPAAKSSSAPAAAKAAEPEPEPEEEDVGMGGLFD
jgi:large subunit ribosomal protein LP0